MLQETLHRYRALHRWQEGNRVFEAVLAVMPAIHPVTAEIADRARGLMAIDSGLGARDAIHAAVALANGCAAICSYERAFDRIAGLARLTP